MKKLLVKSIVLAALVSVLGVWAYGALVYPQLNPPQRHTSQILSEQSEALLRGACFDCHSNETRYPWYASLPGVSVLLGYHVQEGRDELNFSHWDAWSASKRYKSIRESLESVQEGEMPMKGYTLLHPAAAWSGSDLTRVLRDANMAFSANLNLQNLGKSDHNEGDEEDEDHDDDD